VEWIPIASTGTPIATRKLTEAAALTPLATAIAAAPAAHPLLDVRVWNQQISVNLAGNIGLGTIVNASASSNEVGYWLEAMAYPINSSSYSQRMAR
jgi:hypothetical protein